MTRIARSALLVPLLLLAACQHQACPPYAPTAELSVTLYLGRTMPTAEGLPAKAISDEDFAAFLRDELTPRFPDGFTVLDGYGQWRVPATGAISRERSTVIDIVAPESPTLADRIGAVEASYKARFHQLAVGKRVLKACAAF